jgi:lipoic acid synthetase
MEDKKKIRSISSKKSPLNKLPIFKDESEDETVSLGRFPKWLHRQIPQGGHLFKTEAILEKYRLNTVCEEAKCPNRMECYSKKTATFLALGKECTRNCGFCNIDFAKQPKPPEAEEPLRIALSVKELGLKHVVITMVARDDLPDKGAKHIALIIQEIKKAVPEVSIEVLTSDFSGDLSALDLVLNESPDIFNHNIETVRSLTPRVRHKATYQRTLDILRHAKNSRKTEFVKSGIMVGLGETEEEVKETIVDLYQAGSDIITIGHYLQPHRHKLTVKAFITPDQFKKYEAFGYEIGVKHMYCGPFVRSSYNAHAIRNQLVHE